MNVYIDIEMLKHILFYGGLVVGGMIFGGLIVWLTYGGR
jgi:hypothetical protein